MSHAIRRLLILAALAALPACGPRPAGPPVMEAAACAAPDWRALGVEDGSLGRGRSAYDARRTACGLPPSEAAEDAYLSGHADGVVRYCSRENGYRLGRAGVAPTLSCPPHLEPAFSEGYAEGASAPALRPSIGVGVGIGSGGWSGGGVSVWF